MREGIYVEVEKDKSRRTDGLKTILVNETSNSDNIYISS